MIDFFYRNMDVVLFFYGIAFVTLGITIIMQLRITRKSEYKLIEPLWLLAWFGIIHGCRDFLDMFVLIKQGYFYLNSLRSLILVISYLFLFAFGYRLINLGRKRLGLWFPAAAIILLLWLPAFWGISSPFNWDIAARYVLAFTGGILSAAGFMMFYRAERGRLDKISAGGYFVSTALLFFVFAVLEGLIAPKMIFFPASVLNTNAFIALTGVPVQFFRSLCAVGIAWCIWQIMDVFNKEKIEKDERQIKLVAESEKKFRTLFETIKQAIIYHDVKGGIISANPAAERMLGMTFEQMYGKTPQELQWKTLREDGSVLPLGEHPAMLALKSGAEVWNIKMGIYNAKENKNRWVKVDAIPQFNLGESQPYQVYTTYEEYIRP